MTAKPGFLEIWQIGNNGMRNPYRLQNGLLAYANYQKYGHLGTKQDQIDFTEYLNQQGVINSDLEKTNDGTHARKWRYIAQKMGFIYPKVAKGHDQTELGEIDTFTPSGNAYLACKSRAAVYDCFLRAQMMPTEESLYHKGYYFSPIRYTSAVMLELKKLCGSSDIDQLCFDTCVQTADPTIPPVNVAKRIVELKERENKAASRRVFKRDYENSLPYTKNHGNFHDYGNTNKRYFILTGLFEKSGKGIRIAEGKEKLVELIAYGDFPKQKDAFQWQVESCSIPELPTDNAVTALGYYKDIVDVAKSYHILPEKSAKELADASAHEINIARYDLEDRIFDAKEDLYALDQPKEYEEITNYLSLIQSTGRNSAKCEFNGKELSVPASERPAYLEWIAWRSFLAIDHMTNTAAESRHFNIDSSFLPTNTAGGGDCDVYVECGNLIFVVEVTLTSGSRQESAETESVRRHVSDITRKYADKTVLGVFIANEVASETYNTFKNNSYIFDDDVECNPRIVPLTIKQFQRIFNYLFRDGEKYATPQNFARIYDELDEEKSSFSKWRTHIADQINALAV